MQRTRTRREFQPRRRDEDRFSQERRFRNYSNPGRDGYRESDNFRNRFNDEYVDRQENFQNYYNQPYFQDEEGDFEDSYNDHEYDNNFRGEYDDEYTDEDRSEYYPEVWGVSNGSRQYESYGDERIRNDERRNPDYETERISTGSFRRSRNENSGYERSGMRDRTHRNEMNRYAERDSRRSRTRGNRRNANNERSQISNYPRSHRNQFENERMNEAYRHSDAHRNRYENPDRNYHEQGNYYSRSGNNPSFGRDTMGRYINRNREPSRRGQSRASSNLRRTRNARG